MVTHNIAGGEFEMGEKVCAKCGAFIDEGKEKFNMIITKEAGGRIIEFECFHFDC